MCSFEINIFFFFFRIKHWLNLNWKNYLLKFKTFNLKLLFSDLCNFLSNVSKNVIFVKVNIIISRCFYEQEFLSISQWTRITVWLWWRKTKLMDHWRVWHVPYVQWISIILLLQRVTRTRVKTNGLPASARQAGMQASSNALN